MQLLDLLSMLDNNFDESENIEKVLVDLFVTLYNIEDINSSEVILDLDRIKPEDVASAVRILSDKYNA